MATIISDLRQAYRRGPLSMKLIFINVGVFFVCSLAMVFALLFNRSLDWLLDWFRFPSSVTRFLVQPWSLITYMFMHEGILHLLFNMLWLYWFGQLFLSFFTARHLRGLYLLGGIGGALLYMLAYNVFPYFEPLRDVSVLSGASASVLAIVAATAYREPNYPIRLMLMGTVRLKYLALVVIGTDLLFITSANAGGHIAHLGGALSGLSFAALLSKGTDLTAWINRLVESLERLCQSLVSLGERKPRMKVKVNPHANAAAGRQADYDFNARKKAQDDEIDRILDKLKKNGYESLTAQEKKSLFDASKR